MIPLFFVSLVVTFIAVKRFNLSSNAWLALCLIVAGFELARAFLAVFQERERNGWKGIDR